MGLLDSLNYATVSETVREGRPAARVRQGGQVVFNKAANDIIKFPSNTYFKAGSDEEGNIYLLPANADTKNVIKATKNNESFQFRQDGVFDGLGAKYQDSYSVEAGVDGEGEHAINYFKLTKMSKADAAKADAAEKPAPAEKVSAEQINVNMQRKASTQQATKPAQTAKQINDAAIKAAKADFKAAK